MDTTSRPKSSKRRGRQHLPKAQRLADGRFRIRFKVNSKTFDRYCPRDVSADEHNAWQASVHKEIVDRRRTAEHCAAVERPRFAVQPSGAAMLRVALGEFIETDVTPRAHERLKRRRERGAYGDTHKDDYTAQRLNQLFEELEQSHGQLAVSDLKAKMGCDLVGHMKKSNWSPNKCRETVRMLQHFGIWCATMLEATSQIPQVVDAIKHSDMYKTLVRSPTSRAEALKKLPEIRSVLTQIRDAGRPLLYLAVHVQYLTSARPSEVLALKADRVVDDGTPLAFCVPHKNDFRPNADQRFLILNGPTAETIRSLMSVVGQDAIFSPLMFRLVDVMKIPLDDLGRLSQVYQEHRLKLCGAAGHSTPALRRKTACITATDYRNRLKLHGKVLPYDIRHMSISEIARMDTGAAQHAAGHKDPKATARYTHVPLKARKQVAARAADLLGPSLGYDEGAA